MNNRKKYLIKLPETQSSVALPTVLAVTLLYITVAPPSGVSTARLQELGIVSVHYAISELRKRGAIIHAEKGVFIDKFGRRLTSIAHYSYGGWDDHKIADQDVEV